MLHIHGWPVTQQQQTLPVDREVPAAPRLLKCAHAVPTGAKVKAAGQLGALSPPWKLIQAHPGFEPGLMDTLLLVFRVHTPDR